MSSENPGLFGFKVHIFKQIANITIKIIWTVFLISLSIRSFIRMGQDKGENFTDRFSDLHCKIIFFDCVSLIVQ